jgi:hypothetical protein
MFIIVKKETVFDLSPFFNKTMTKSPFETALKTLSHSR